jgi:hypothetical protein
VVLVVVAEALYLQLEAKELLIKEMQAEEARQLTLQVVLEEVLELRHQLQILHEAVLDLHLLSVEQLPFMLEVAQVPLKVVEQVLVELVVVALVLLVLVQEVLEQLTLEAVEEVVVLAKLALAALALSSSAIQIHFLMP